MEVTWNNAVRWQKVLMIYSQKEIADKLDVSIQRVHSWAKKGVEPRLNMKFKLSQMFDETPEDKRVPRE